MEKENENSNSRVRLQMKLFPDMPPEDIEAVNLQEKLDKCKSEYQKFKVRNHYGKAVNHNKDGRMCAKCKHIIYDGYHRNNYYKCELIGRSRCSATDVRLSYVCDKFEER